MVLTPESPPVSPKTIRHAKRSRQSRHSSQDGLEITELSPDDMGYDADAEVVRPDQYEEPESDFEDEVGIRKLWPDTDDELAGKMKRLSWNPKRHRPKSALDSESRPTTPNVRADTTKLNKHGKRTEIEVSELVGGHGSAPPAKRRRRKESRSNVAQRLMGNARWKVQTDTSDKTDEKHTAILESSGSTVPSETPVLPMDGNEMELD